MSPVCTKRVKGAPLLPSSGAEMKVQEKLRAEGSKEGGKKISAHRSYALCRHFHTMFFHSYNNALQ